MTDTEQKLLGRASDLIDRISKADYTVNLVAKEVAKSRWTKITESQVKQILHQAAKRYSEKITEIIEFG